MRDDRRQLLFEVDIGQCLAFLRNRNYVDLIVLKCSAARFGNNAHARVSLELMFERRGDVHEWFKTDFPIER